jgi:hypothetical protein
LTQPAAPGVSHEDYAAWVGRTYRAVDLEGLELDGLGYSVTITGPPKKRHKLSKKAMDLRKASGCFNDEETLDEERRCKPAFEIATRTSFSISRSF